MFIRFPAPPGGLARNVSLLRSGQDGDEVLLKPVPSLPVTTQQHAADAKPLSGVDATPSSTAPGSSFTGNDRAKR